MLFISILIYLAVALPLTVLLWTALTAAKWGDTEKDKPYDPSLIGRY